MQQILCLKLLALCCHPETNLLQAASNGSVYVQNDLAGYLDIIQ